MARSRTKPRETRVWFEVLQNGVLVASSSRPLKKASVVSLTSKLDTGLSIPFYPLPRDIDIVQIRNQVVFLQIDQPWDGFATSRGQYVPVQRTQRVSRTIEMTTKDIASIALGDLRLLIRIGPEIRKHGRAVKRITTYRGSWSELLFPSRQERLTLAGAAAAAVTCVALFTAALKVTPHHKVSRIEDLDGAYTIGFISPDSFRNAPEALQDRLDRRNYFRSTIAFYRAFTAMIMNLPVPDHYAGFLYPTTRKTFEGLFSTWQERVDTKLERQRAAEKAALAVPAAVVAVPAAVGESAEGKILRAISKVDVLHKTLEETLERKRALKKALKLDPKYDYMAYKNVAVNERAREALSRIQPWKGVTDEEMMYLESESLARRASRAQDKTLGVQEGIPRLQPPEHRPIGIRAGSAFASFLHPDVDRSLDKRFAQLQASEYGKTLVENVIQEPLVGEIEPELIEAQIRKYRFEVQLCYEHALRRNQETAGKTQWKWRVDSRGKISDVDLMATDISDPEMAQCIRKKIARWTFPRPRRGAIEVKYTFDFERAKG